MAKGVVEISLDREAIDFDGVEKAFGAILSGTAAWAKLITTGDLIAGASVLGSFFTAIGEISANDKPERLAFVLVSGALVRTLEMTLAELLAENKLILTPVGVELKHLRIKMLDRLQSGDATLTGDFFANPNGFAFLHGFAEDMLETLGGCIERPEHSNLAHRLSTNFTSSLLQTWSLNAEAFQPLQQALSSPFDEARNLEIEQQRYLNHIQTQFSDAKLIGQTGDDPVLLSEVFVPLRAYWQRPVKGEEESDSQNAKDTSRDPKTKRVLVDFGPELSNWIDLQSTGTGTDPIRIVSGGPGIGKSTSLRAVAAELARSGKCFPVFVPLQRIAGNGDLAERIGEELQEIDAWKLSHNPLGEKLDHYCGRGPVVLFLDGLDEIVAAGSDGETLTRDFVRDVKAKIENKNAAQARTRMIAIISGRIPAAEKAIRQLGLEGEQILHLLPFAIPNNEHGKFASGTSAEKLKLDQRITWWGKWYVRRPGDGKEIPPLLVSEQFEDVSVEPLLFYFLVLVRAWEASGEGTKISRNSVYRRVLEEFHQREKAKNTGGMADEFSEYESEFEIILQAMAMAAWRGGTSRIGKLADVKLFLKDWNNKLKGKFEQALGNRKEQHTFGASLFFHARESGGDGTFEFMHKSFTEYLVARRFRLSLSRLVKRYRELEENDEDKSELLKRWIWTWGTRNVDSDVLGFIRGEFTGPQPAEDIDVVAAIFKLGLKSGYPAHGLAGEEYTFDNPPKTFAAMSDWARNAEEALLAGLNASILARRDDDPDVRHPAIALEDAVEAPSYSLVLGNLLTRLLRQRDQGFVAYHCLAGLDFHRANLTGANLLVANLLVANLFGANLLGANLRGAKLSEANLSRADLRGANLLGADLSRADLKEANIVEGELSNTDLASANLNRADLTGANLRNSRLKDSNLEESNLSNTHLRGANFFGATLRKANLIKADLCGANLTNADLSESNLNGSELLRAKFYGTNLIEADLTCNSSITEAFGIPQARHVDKAFLPKGWSVDWKEGGEAWDITTPDGPYVDPRERKARS